MKTLGEFIVEKQHEFSHATGELTALLSAIKLGAKIIHRDINKEKRYRLCCRRISIL